MGASVLTLARLVVVALWLLMLGRVLASWIDPRMGSSVARALYRTTEPMLAPVRNLLPRNGTIDVSPIVVFLVLAALLFLLR